VYCSRLAVRCSQISRIGTSGSWLNVSFVFCLHKSTTINNTKCKSIKIFYNYFCNKVAVVRRIVRIYVQSKAKT
jgi:hypothetical protein